MLMVYLERTFGAAGTGRGFRVLLPVTTTHLCVVGLTALADCQEAMAAKLATVEMLARRREGL